MEKYIYDETMKIKPDKYCKQFLEILTPVSGNMMVRFVNCKHQEDCTKKDCFLKKLEKKAAKPEEKNNRINYSDAFGKLLNSIDDHLEDIKWTIENGNPDRAMELIEELQDDLY